MSWVKKALTRKVVVRGKKGSGREVEFPPDTKLLYGVYFAIVSLAGLVALQIAVLIVLETWNSEIFAAITGLIGTILGVFFGKKS